MEDNLFSILLIDDDEDDYIITRDLVSEIKGNKFELNWVHNYEKGLEAILQKKYDVYLIDYRLGPHTGLDLLREAIAGGCTSPLILLKGQGDRDIDVEAMQAGAMDYLIKGETDAAMLERSIRYAVKQKKSEEALYISEERLRHSQKMEAIGRLAGGIAHDFNNLLTVINGYSELLLRRMPADDSLIKYANEINKAGEKAAALTNQLLTLSRKRDFQPKVIALNDVIINMQNMLQRLIGENVGLITELDPNLALIKADPGQIEQVIMNLAVNARDAMPAGGKIILSTQTVKLNSAYTSNLIDLRPGSYVKLSVSDTGHGINQETLAHIFEPFYTTKEKGKGTGLGLATVFGIVQCSNGGIEVESTPDKGTIFDIYWPCIDKVILYNTNQPAKKSDAGSQI